MTTYYSARVEERCLKELKAASEKVSVRATGIKRL